MTMLLSTNEMVAEEVADRVAALADGEIIESKTPEEIITNPKNERTKILLSRVLKTA